MTGPQPATTLHMWAPIVGMVRLAHDPMNEILPTASPEGFGTLLIAGVR